MRKFTAVLMLLLLGGCLGGYSPTNKFYYLQSVDVSEISVLSRKKLSIGVNDVVLPDYLDRPQIIVFDQGSPQMKIDETNRWGEAPATMIQRTLAADIAAYLPQSAVKAKISLDERFSYLVNVQIVRMDMIEGGEAVFEAWWSVYNAAGNRLLQQKTSLRQKTDDGFDAYVEAESRMIAAMGRDIAKAVAGLK